jgi:hypothetical protein
VPGTARELGDLMSRRGIAVRLGGIGVLACSGLVIVAGPAGASKVTATGTASCAVTSSLSFNPPLQPGIGTQVANGQAEIVTISPLTFSGCSGSSATLPLSGTPTKPVAIKVKANVLNKKLYAGGCLFLTAMQLQIKHVTVAWTPATGALRPTRVSPGIAPLSADLAGNLGFSFTGSATGSFGGPATLSLYTDAAGTAALEACQSNVGGGISSLPVDASASSLSLG